MSRLRRGFHSGNKTSETNPLSEKTVYDYDANGNETSSTDPLGHSSTTVFNSMNREVEQADPLGRTAKTEYDLNGNVVAKTDPLGNTTSSEYDADGRLISETDPLGHATAYSYDAAGRLSSKTDANEHATTYGYDAAGQKTSVTAPGGAVTTYDYDATGNVVKRTDANDHATKYSFDAAGNKTSKENALGSTWTYSYDGNGNLTRTKTPSGGTITQSYDSENRLLGKSYSDGTSPVSYSYDPAGNKLTQTDVTGITRYTYDAADRRVSASSAAGSFLYSYDLDGNLTSHSYPNGLRTSYSYNDAGDMATAQVGREITRYSFDGNGQLVWVLHPNGILDARSYDAAGRLTEITGTAPHGKPFYSRIYTYDSVGNPTSLEATDAHEHSSSLSWWRKARMSDEALSRWAESYSYDSRDRLTKACMNAHCSRYYAYAYDGVGNRTSLETRKAVTLYSYDAADELLSASEQKHAHHQDVTLYAYDLNGNQNRAGSTLYVYNLENKLTSVKDEHGRDLVSYTYGAEGLMAARSTHSQTTSYAWDTSSELPELAVETDSKGQGRSAVKDVRSYTYGSGPLGIVQGRDSYTFHTDSLGSVVKLSDDHGKLVQSYRYSPYGENYGPGASGEAQDTELNPIRFTGQYLDSEAGLYNMRAREYEPETGRFLEVDPLQCDSGGSCGSVYVYVDDQPTVKIDPSGEKIMMAIDWFPSIIDFRTAKPWKLSTMGQNFIASHEGGVRLRPYNDWNGYCTVGVGHLLHYSACTAGDFRKWNNAGKSRLWRLFITDYSKRERTVNRFVTVRLYQHEFDAMVDFDYWTGCLDGGPSNCTALRYLNKRQYARVPKGMRLYPKTTCRLPDDITLYTKGKYKNTC